MSSSPQILRTQADRSSRTKRRLIDATIGCLIEHGYAYTSTVEICSRADLTRGAYNHHYSGLPELFTDVLEDLYARLAETGAEVGPAVSLESIIREAWSKLQRPDFKAVIELWLASRNDPDLGRELAPAIARLSRLFEPESNPDLAKLIGSDAQRLGLYRLAFEATIGLALGRATSPGGAAVEHEDQVMDVLLSLARERDRAAVTNSS